MRSVLLIVATTIALVSCMASATFASDDDKFAVSMMEQFKAFKAKYNKDYASTQEESVRFGHFVANMKRSAELNKANPNGRFGATVFSDLSAAEFKKTHHNLDFTKRARAPVVPESQRAKSSKYPGGVGAPKNFDWRGSDCPKGPKNCVNPIKNQAQCGSCWAFSTIDTIETSWALTHSLESLSEENIVQCDHNDDGCDGGDPGSAFKWLLSAQDGWISSESHYPYTSGDGNTGQCHQSLINKAAKVTGYHDVSHSEDEMAAYLAQHGVLSICVDASTWQSYQGGVVCGSPYQIDHCVGLVGYDSTSRSTPYWIVRNSWSTSWGEEGYMYVKMGQNCYGLDGEPRFAITSGTPTPPGPPGPSPPPGPGPSPSPPPGPTPSPPAHGNATQYWCKNQRCDLAECSKHSFPQNTCLKNPEGATVEVHCEPRTWVLKVWPYSGDCSGYSYEQRQELNTCIRDDEGSYLYNSCPSGAAAAVAKKSSNEVNELVLRSAGARALVDGAIKRAREAFAKDHKKH